MLPKPKHLSSEYAAQFKDQGIVEAYHYRPPHPSEVFETLAELVTDEPRTVLDVGCGIGDIARRLVDFVERVEVKTEIENALEMERLNLEGLARVHLRLAGIMQRQGPAIAEQYKISYPFDLEKSVIRYASKELQLLGLDACLKELYKRVDE